MTKIRIQVKHPGSATLIVNTMHYAPLSPTVAEEAANPEGEKGEPDG
jgi:hypothetical protein